MREVNNEVYYKRSLDVESCRVRNIIDDPKTDSGSYKHYLQANSGWKNTVYNVT